MQSKLKHENQGVGQLDFIEISKAQDEVLRELCAKGPSTACQAALNESAWYVNRGVNKSALKNQSVNPLDCYNTTSTCTQNKGQLTTNNSYSMINKCIKSNKK